MWRHLTPHDAPRPCHSKASMDRIGFMMGGSKWCQPLSGGAWHWWLVACVWAGWLVFRARLACHDWPIMMMCNQMLCARQVLVGAGLMHRQMLVG